MSILRIPNPRPKILTRFTLEAGLETDIEVSVSSQYDTKIEATVPAGDYYMAGDGRPGDFFHAFLDAVNAVLESAAGATYHMTGYIDDSGYVKFKFFDTAYTGAQSDVRFLWGADADMISLASYLGFQGGTDANTDDYPEFTAEYPHPYGWYADEVGYIAEDPAFLTHKKFVHQSVTPSGKIKTVEYGGYREGFLKLQHIPEALMFSDNTAYEALPPYPLTYNKGLECWYLEAVKGTPFRYYRNGIYGSAFAVEAGVSTAAASDFQLTDTSKSWTSNQWDGYVLHIEDFFATGWPFRSEITVNSPTVLTFGDTADTGETKESQSYLICAAAFETLVLARQSALSWKPLEVKGVDRWDTQRFRFIEYTE